LLSPYDTKKLNRLRFIEDFMLRPLTVYRLSAAPLWVGALTALAGIALLPGSARAQITLPVYFDGIDDGHIAAPYVGTGSFTFNVDPGDGTYTDAQLGGVSYSFTIDGTTFTQADTVSVPTSTFYILSTTLGGTRRVQFTDGGSGAGGPFRGSLDAENGAGKILSFEPTYVKESLNRYYTGIPNTIRFGNYYIADIPEPGAVAFAVIAASGVLGLVARRRKG
jgi:hypothetical protein